MCILAPTCSPSIGKKAVAEPRAITGTPRFAVVSLLIKIELSNIIRADESVVDTSGIEETSRGLGMPTIYPK